MFGIVVSWVLVKCQWGLFIKLEVLVCVTSWKTLRKREHEPEKAGWGAGGVSRPLLWLSAQGWVS